MCIGKNSYSLFLIVLFLIIGDASISSSEIPFIQNSGFFEPNISEIATGEYGETPKLVEQGNSIALNVLFGFGVYSGAIIILLVYSSLVYINVKQPLFLWYGFYILFLSIHVFLISGLVIAPESKLFYQIGIPNALLIQVAFTRFFQFLVHMQKQFKEMHKWMNYHVYFSLIASILYFVLPYPELIISLMRIGLISSVLIVAWSLRNNGELSPTESKLMLGSLMFLIAAGILLGINQWTVWLPTALLFGWGIAFIAMHILWISVSILYRVKKLNDKRESLWLDIRQTKKDLLDRYLKGVEEEKFRIVYELENNVLVEIESLKGAIVSLPESNLETQKELDRIQSSVTNITSELIGNQVTHSRFIIQIENFVARHQSDKTQFSLHFFNFSGGLLPEVEEQLYRIIQEAVQNIEKYANASTVEIQIIQNETELILSIEDNGDGFDPKEKSDGIGVLNMRKRAFDIGGTLNISTSLGNGTSVFVALRLRN